MPPTKAQTVKIHIALHELGLSDENYRDILALHFKAQSSKELCPRQAEALLGFFRAKGWKEKRTKNATPRPAPRSDFIHVRTKQQRMVISLWLELGYKLEDLHKRAKSQFGSDRFEWVTSHEHLATLIYDLNQRLKRRKEQICTPEV